MFRFSLTGGAQRRYSAIGPKSARKGRHAAVTANPGTDTPDRVMAAGAMGDV